MVEIKVAVNFPGYLTTSSFVTLTLTFKVISRSSQFLFFWATPTFQVIQPVRDFLNTLYISCVLKSLVAFMCRCVLILIVVCKSSELLNNILYWAKFNNLSFIFLIKYIYFDSFNHNYHCFFFMHLTKSWQFMLLVWISVFKFHI